jgi:hypothetical protein
MNYRAAGNVIAGFMVSQYIWEMAAKETGRDELPFRHQSEWIIFWGNTKGVAAIAELLLILREMVLKGSGFTVLGSGL